MKRLVTLAALSVLALTGCAAAPPPAFPDEVSTPTATEAPAVSAFDEPCSVVQRSELNDIVGVTFGDGRVITWTVTSSDIVWSPSRCVWGTGDGLELTIDFADAAAFEGGELQCVRPARFEDEITEIPGLGDQAFWVISDLFGVDGELRICTSDALIDIIIETEAGDPDVLHGQATELAGLILDRY